MDKNELMFVGLTRWRFLSFLFTALCLIPASAFALGPYIENGDGTVTDSGSGLMWQQADDSNGHTWEQAISYCEGLNLAGHGDWRLPNIRELKSIVDPSRYNPAIDSVFSCQASYYWSATTRVSNPDYAWYVYFYGGFDRCYGKSYTFYVRCVRGGL